MLHYFWQICHACKFISPICHTSDMKTLRATQIATQSLTTTSVTTDGVPLVILTLVGLPCVCRGRLLFGENRAPAVHIICTTHCAYNFYHPPDLRLCDTRLVYRDTRLVYRDTRLVYRDTRLVYRDTRLVYRDTRVRAVSCIDSASWIFLPALFCVCVCVNMSITCPLIRPSRLECWNEGNFGGTSRGDDLLSGLSQPEQTWGIDSTMCTEDF